MSYERAGMGLTALMTPRIGLAKTSTKTTTSGLAPLSHGYVRVPSGERRALKSWVGRYMGTTSAAYKNHLAKDPNFTSAHPDMLAKFRRAKRRAELVAAKEGVMCLSGSQRDKAIKTLDFWRRCDKPGWAAWNPVIMSQSKYGTCVSAPLSLINYWVQDSSLRGGRAQCPVGSLDGVSFKDELFGFNAIKAEEAKAPAGQAHVFQTFAQVKFEVPGTPDEAADLAQEEAEETARQAEDEADLANGNGIVNGNGEPPTDADYEEETDIGKYLMWGAVGLVAAGGIGYAVWKFVLKPEGAVR
jgi:hypothetical protein